MRIVKIIERPLSPNEEGDWAVYCQMLVGNSYQYGVLLYSTQAEAMNTQEGEIVDIEKVRFSRRINNVQL